MRRRQPAWTATVRRRREDSAGVPTPIPRAPDHGFRPRPHARPADRHAPRGSLQGGAKLVRSLRKLAQSVTSLAHDVARFRKLNAEFLVINRNPVTVRRFG